MTFFGKGRTILTSSYLNQHAWIHHFLESFEFLGDNLKQSSLVYRHFHIRQTKQRAISKKEWSRSDFNSDKTMGRSQEWHCKVIYANRSQNKRNHTVQCKRRSYTKCERERKKTKKRAGDFGEFIYYDCTCTEQGVELLLLPSEAIDFHVLTHSLKV